jgi:hypothetical protein
LSGERGTGAIGPNREVLGAGVGFGDLNVTFFPPSPEALLILLSSDSHTAPSASISCAWVWT